MVSPLACKRHNMAYILCWLPYFYYGGPDFYLQSRQAFKHYVMAMNIVFGFIEHAAISTSVNYYLIMHLIGHKQVNFSDVRAHHAYKYQGEFRPLIST